jgi:hypothetical protein
MDDESKVNRSPSRRTLFQSDAEAAAQENAKRFPIANTGIFIAAIVLVVLFLAFVSPARRKIWQSSYRVVRQLPPEPTGVYVPKQEKTMASCVPSRYGLANPKRETPRSLLTRYLEMLPPHC